MSRSTFECFHSTMSLCMKPKSCGTLGEFEANVELKDFWLSLHTENVYLCLSTFQNNEGENLPFCHQQVLILQTAASVKVFNTIHMPIIFSCDGRRITGALCNLIYTKPASYIFIPKSYFDYFAWLCLNYSQKFLC